MGGREGMGEGGREGEYGRVKDRLRILYDG